MIVLLVEPPKKTWGVMGDYIAPPLGLAQLAAVLEKENIPVEIVDCIAQGIPMSSLQQIILEVNPSLIGATALTPSFYDALEVLRIAKKASGEIVTVLGGPHVTFTPEETLLNHTEVDYIVRGEGEQTLLDLVNCLDRGKNPQTVKGIAFRNGEEIFVTPDQPLVDVDTLPLPAYHLLPMEKYRFTVLDKYATVLASRGCPFQCSFCAEWRFWGAKWRPRDPVKVVDEIELLHKEYDRESFWFGDDCFNIRSDHVKGICEEITRRCLDISWFYQGRADSVITQQDLLPQMRACGNLMVQIGVESSTDRELEQFKKKLKTDQIKEAVDLLRKNDIVSQGLIIVGTREDTADSIIHKLRTMKWLDPDFPIFTTLTPFPGSDTYQEARANGWIEKSDYELFDMSHVIMPTEHLTRDQLSSILYWCFKSYYMDPVKIAKGLLSRNSWKRKIWQHMLKYTGKQILSSLKWK
ncbi:MAG: radical SAM protein [Candidatus Aminicenantes bacterium]|jgi:anaerobic magnesium-protoporphyrin IX monomethyl ester cyclase